ncbi:MAG: formyltetrahydrofolate deformylase [Salinivirgaceae bacterium]|nr:formyltetrahydrofolate deformylase [Salinivirgaceae bacterium]
MNTTVSTATILMHCRDQRGIVAKVTEFIQNNHGNILQLDQHVDHEDGQFFMRIQWDLSEFIIPKNKIQDYFQTLIASSYDMEFKIYLSEDKPRMALFVSKMDHCLFDILARYQSKEWEVEIPLVISNHEDMRKVVEQFGIPYYCFPITKENKAEQEAKELKLLEDNDISFVVLARYMQVVSEDFINHYPNKIINIHHSFLPAFTGAKPYHAAFKRGVKIIGATSHYVTTDLDEGPIIEQDVTRITHRDTIDSLVLKGRDLEKIVLSRAIRYHIQRRILVYNNKTIVFG